MFTELPCIHHVPPPNGDRRRFARRRYYRRTHLRYFTLQAVYKWESSRVHAQLPQERGMAPLVRAEVILIAA